MHTYAERYVRVHLYIHVDAHAHRYAQMNALRISQETDELSLNADSLSKGQRFSEQLESKPELQQPMRRVAISKYVTRNLAETRIVIWLQVISASLGFPSERLSLTSVYTSPSLSLFARELRTNKPPVSSREHTESNRYSSRRSGD